jgi:hypothetical protein
VIFEDALPRRGQREQQRVNRKAGVVLAAGAVHEQRQIAFVKRIGEGSRELRTVAGYEAAPSLTAILNNVDARDRLRSIALCEAAAAIPHCRAEDATVIGKMTIDRLRWSVTVKGARFAHSPATEDHLAVRVFVFSHGKVVAISARAVQAVRRDPLR